MLAPILDPADGQSFIQSEPGKADFFRQQNSLVPEAAADIGRHDANAALLDAKRVGEPVAHDVRHLRTGVERELVEPVIEGGDDPAAFHRRHALTRGRDFMA